MKITVKRETVFTYSGLSIGLILLMLVIFGMILTGCARENVYGSGRIVTEERQMERFDGLTIEGPVEIQVRQGQQLPVKIEAEDNVMRLIETHVSGSTLRVKIRNGVNLKRIKPIHVYVQGEQYKKIIFSGSGSLKGPDTIRATGFTYEINGSADADLKVDANEVRMYVNGSGNLRLEGRSNAWYSEINGSGNVGGRDFQTASADMNVNGSGEQTIWVTDRLDARISGSGNIRYKGAPGTVNVKIAGSGKVIKL
ncbi:head GIN domain-containing protein [Chitinophaga sp. 22620]|uniref:head GIN domain-containing protein n=1 Tax=Chitinophaga sp. 22620 TaxID=3453952 RepID=UPI003F86A189